MKKNGIDTAELRRFRAPKLGGVLGTGVLLFFTFFGNNSWADSVNVKARAWPTQIKIGDEIKLSIQIEYPRNFSIKPLSFKTPVAPFEIKNVEMASPRETGPSAQQTFLVKLTVFQLGDLQIPPLPVNFTDPDGHPGQAWTEPLRVKVSSVIKNPKEKAELRPIKGPLSLDTTALRELILGTLAFFLTVWLIVKVFLRRQNKKLLDLESLLPPHQRATLELDRLLAKAMLNEGKVKEFYSELADILRRYLERRFKVETLELTTFEILQHLKEKEFSSDLAQKIKEILENSDLVKFAKFIPPRSLADQLVGSLRDLVDRTKPVEEEGLKK